MLDHSRDWRRPQRPKPSPAVPEAGAETLVRGAERGFADRAIDGDAAEQFLLGAELAKPLVLGGGQRLAGNEAGAGIGDAQLGGLFGLVISRRVGGDAGHGHVALLDDVVTVL